MKNFWVSTKMNKYIFTLEEKEIINITRIKLYTKNSRRFFFQCTKLNLLSTTIIKKKWFYVKSYDK